MPRKNKVLDFFALLYQALRLLVVVSSVFLYLAIQWAKLYWYRYRFRRTLARYMPKPQAEKLYRLYAETMERNLSLRAIVSKVLR